MKRPGIGFYTSLRPRDNIGPGADTNIPSYMQAFSSYQVLK